MTLKLAARTLAKRAPTIDWSRPVFSLSPEVAASYNKLKSWVSMSDSMAAKYSKPPAGIDFNGAKAKVKDTELVDMLEKFYASSTPPAETHEWPAEEQEMTDAQIAYLKELDALHKELLPVLKEELAFQESNRTDESTTIFDLKVNYPLMHEEIEDELENRQWFKDTGIGSSK